MPIIPQALRRLKTARALFDEGKFEAAERELAEVLVQNPELLDAHVLLGVIAARTNRLAEATLRLEQALAVEPERYDALVWLATVKRSQNKIEEAIELLKRALKLQANDAEALGLLGICQLSLGLAVPAGESFQAVVRLRPQSAEGFHNLGMALRLQNRSAEALQAFERALKLAPDHPQNYLQVFKQLQHLSRWPEALEVLEKGLLRHPNSVALGEALGIAYGRMNAPEKAEEIFLRLADKDPSAAASYATWLQEVGRFADSIPVLNTSIRLNPIQGTAYRGLAEAKVFEVDGEPLVHRIHAVLGSSQLDSRARAQLFYGLGKSYEQMGEYLASIQAFDEANRLAYGAYPASQGFDPVSVEREPEIMAEVYSEEVIDRLKSFGLKSDRPIFIVGMIRSGTTLLDQILSSHPSIVSAGEQGFWNVEADQVHREWRVAPNSEEIAKLGARYLSILDQGGWGGLKITDKMPLNFRHLGLIHVVFPNAKMIHIRRNPLDTCLSIYTTFFFGGPNFVYRQENIVTFYRAYLRMMSHWRSVLPASQWMEIDYEQLVSDPGGTIQSVTDFLGVPWDEGCLRPETNSSPVSTPSRWQARQPIYPSSVNRWRRFEPWLGPLLQLKDVTHP